MARDERVSGNTVAKGSFGRTSWLAVAGIFLLPLGAAAQDSYKIIVNPANPIASLSKKELSDIFLKKISTWDNGQPVQPVDQAQASDVRQAFSREMLGLSPDNAARQQAAAGGDPALSVATDREVLAFVRLKPGAIGYVSSNAVVTGVRVLAVGVSGVNAARSSQVPIPVGDTVKAPVKVSDVRPVYPATARAARVEGSVDVQ